MGPQGGRAEESKSAPVQKPKESLGGGGFPGLPANPPKKGEAL